METNNINDLPPSKRFKHLQCQSGCLPAKKRMSHRPNHQPTPVCLPLKKRIWAINSQYQDIDGPTNLIGEEEDEEKQKCVEQVTDDDGEDGIICAVCGSTDADPTDPIVFCDGCDVTVHASCYGSPLSVSVPAGDWFCRKCEFTASNPQCCLCPTKGGALKPTLDDRWAHIVCALYVPEAFFRDPEGREGIDVSRVPPERREVECCVCGCKSGCGIGCAEPGCEVGFHVSCGLEEGLAIEYREGRGGAIVAGFCREHTLLWKKQQLTGKFKIVARESNSKRKAKG